MRRCVQEDLRTWTRKIRKEEWGHDLLEGRDNQMGHAKKLKIDTKQIAKDYAECKKWCQTH